MVKRPSEKIAEVLSGAVMIEDADPAIASNCRFFIYQGACAILSKSTKKERQEALLKIPENIRPHVETEAIRLWRYRKGIG